jgi:transposase
MYDLPLRLKATIHYHHFTRNIREVARIYDVGRSTVSRWVKNTPLTSTPVKVKRTRVTKYPDLDRLVVDELRSNPFKTCMELSYTLRQRHDVIVSRATVHRAVKRNNLTYKLAMRSRTHQIKNMSHPFYALLDPYNADTIAIDETCFYHNDSPRRGWGPTGVRVPKKPSCSRVKTSFLLAIDRAGIVKHESLAGNFNSISFAAFLETLPDGKNIIMDNVAFHRSNVVKSVAVRKRLTLNFIPPYSPWHNPVEYAFSSMKARYRKLRLAHGNVASHITMSLESIDSTMTSNLFDHAQKLYRQDLQEAELNGR